MLIGYRNPRIIIVQGDAGLYSYHRFKHLGAHNLCLQEVCCDVASGCTERVATG